MALRVDCTALAPRGQGTTSCRQLHGGAASECFRSELTARLPPSTLLITCASHCLNVRKDLGNS